ncbi:phage head closure protein [Clostridium kluyveri]|uniref:Head-tail adaptor protein n=1 Tax=Clostridium kluyveri TaxID=1534 RepID=A0A1L5FA81_CLOKL|nr:phage head closure protein [Clostridium kluyveri]APM39873.1 head-tail adaptor protein [Clostridium kluyveri]
MRTEELRHKITFQSLTTSTNENGFEEEIWEGYLTVWAGVSNLYAREFFQAAAVQAEKTVKFTIRFIKGIDESMRILFGDKQYNITSIDNIKYRNRYMEIKALEVESSG